MSKVLTPSQNAMQTMSKKLPNPTTPTQCDSTTSNASSLAVDFDDFTTSSSILEFLSKEQECCNEADAESIFQEVNRLADNSDTRSVDEILREAELLIQQQAQLGGKGGTMNGYELKRKKNNNSNSNKPCIKLNTKYTKRIDTVHSQMPIKLLNGHCPIPMSSRTEALKFKAKSLEMNEIAPTATPTSTPTPQTPSDNGAGKHFAAFVDNLPSVSVISEESTPKDLQHNFTMTETEKANEDEDATIAQFIDDDTDGTDTIEEITEGVETIELVVNEDAQCQVAQGKNFDVKHAIANDKNATTITTNRNVMHSSTSMLSSSTVLPHRAPHTKSAHIDGRRPSCDAMLMQHSFASPPQTHIMASPTRRMPLNFNATQACSPSPSSIDGRCNSGGTRRTSLTVSASASISDSGISQMSQSPHTPRPHSPHSRHNVSTNTMANAFDVPDVKMFSDKSVNSSPKRFVSALTSPIEPIANISREHALKLEIEQLQEKLKDTEERLQSLRIQHESLSQLHRDLRENNTHLQEESEVLKLDVQHLNECANILRSELQSARRDRNEALELQKVLQMELEECRQEKKCTQERKDKDTKTIQDLQRQCREMERILMRKHPDSVSALIVASKNPGKCASNDQENMNSRKLLEQRIAQLEADAKEQDLKAQQILANVQARFNSVQAKYETHIADLETQVLSLQEINTKLNEKIESQVRTLDYFVRKKAEKYYNNCTQTDPMPNLMMGESTKDAISENVEDRALPLRCPQLSSAATQTAAKRTITRDHSTNTIGTSTQHSASSSTSSTANSTPNTSRPNSKQSGLRKPNAALTNSLSSALASKLPISYSDSTIAQQSHSIHHATAKEDAHLLATIRGMRVDLAIKDKAMQRLTRELDECKKTIRKLQREKDANKAEKSHSGISSTATTSKRLYSDGTHSMEQITAGTENQALKEAQNKIKLLEADYKSLHDKRLQDLKTLQTAHERELASCHETVRILQQRLNERDEAFAMQKRRKLPVDYYALKAKVSSLERRHSEREERLHMLVEALSKGRLNGALEELLTDNNNQ